MSKSDYKYQILIAKQCEQFIASFLSDNDSPLIREPKNFVAKAQKNQLEVTRCYHEALKIYCQFNKKDEALNLLDDLFMLVDNCLNLFNHTNQTGLITFCLRLLTIQQNHETINKLEHFRKGVKEEWAKKLSDSINAKLFEQHLDFWLLDSCFNLLSHLIDDANRINLERKRVEVLILHAQNSLVVRNIAEAQARFKYAADIAHNLGEKEQAENLLKLATELSLQIHSTPPRPNSIEADLEQALYHERENIVSHPFLPSVQDFLNEYSLIEDKLSYLLQDERLIVNKSKITALVESKPISLNDWTPSSNLDQFANTREYQHGVDIDIKDEVGKVEITTPIHEYQTYRLYHQSYMKQIIDVVSNLFELWKKSGDLTENHILEIVQTSNFQDYDFNIFGLGVKKYFEAEYIISAHLLIPQFENILRTWLEKAGISVKKMNPKSKDIIWGQKILDDLLNDDLTKRYFGEDLVQQMIFYLSKSVDFGYRHKIAHGFMTSNQFTYQISAVVIWFTLLVVTKPLPNLSNKP